MAIIIIDYGLSNLGSIKRSLEECGADVFVSNNSEDIKTAEKIILPGVGSFADGMKNLTADGWHLAIKKEVLENKIPILGICLGMELLASKGTEGGINKGLNLIPGVVMPLTPSVKKERIPHVGWNDVNHKESNILFKDIPSGKDFYFVHSYQFIADDDDDVIATTPYCGGIVSAINKDNIWGTQFHPEKSIPVGFKILRNFINY